MSTVIKTNKIAYKINHESYGNEYDVFILETSDKYIKQGAYILDATAFCDDILSVKFESGRKLYILMKKNGGNKEKLKMFLKSMEEGDRYCIQLVKISDVKDYILIQLLMNALGTYESEYMRINNLTGHLYCFHPKWIKHGKENGQDVIWKIPCLEFNVNSQYCLDIKVRTFTSERLKKKMSFKRRKFEEYPKYVFSANNTLRRRLRNENETGFILRQVDGVKSEITFLDLQNIERFEKSKMGILRSVICSFNERYAGICELDFENETVSERLDYSKCTQREEITVIKEIVSQKGIHIVDQIGDNYSEMFCKEIKRMLLSKYDADASVGKRIRKDRLNIILIHNADYYEGINDPHEKQYLGVSVQHITFEDFAESSEFAISTVIHEMVIKQDLLDGRISLFDWKKTGFEHKVSFGMKASIDDLDRYYFMTVYPDGRFEISEQELTLFEMNEYTEIADIFEEAKFNSEVIKGVIKFDDGTINIIKDTGLFTIPNNEEIWKLLKENDNKLRGKRRRDELLASCLDIKMFGEDDQKYYFVGTIGEGMRQSIQRATVIRKVEGYNGSRIRIDRLLNMMNVSFVHNGQLTIMPFPFKYLREYITNI